MELLAKCVKRSQSKAICTFVWYVLNSWHVKVEKYQENTNMHCLKFHVSTLKNQIQKVKYIFSTSSYLDPTPFPMKLKVKLHGEVKKDQGDSQQGMNTP